MTEPDDMIEHTPPITDQLLAVISSALLDITRILGRIEERLMHLEALAGVASREYIDDDSRDSQSVLRREWDAVNRQWVYSPEGEPE